MAGIQIHTFWAGESNYNYLIFDEGTRSAVAVDPLEGRLVLDEAKRLRLTIKYIVNTHGHQDHIAGNSEVKKATGACLAAGALESIPGCEKGLHDGHELRLDGITMKVLFTPGHTAGHICLVVNDECVMVGDTLFLAGCGNCKFGGNPAALYESLARLSNLPDHLKIYCGHEYALKNLDFCMRQEPDNALIERRKNSVEKTLKAGKVPVTTLKEEKDHNVFLRSSARGVYQALRRKFPDLKQDPQAVFLKLRELRNDF